MSKKDKEIEGQDEIVVNDPQVLRPVELPLVIELPESASKAQIAFTKVLNSYAYKNPEKWAKKKDDQTVTDANGKVSVIKGLISQLKDLKDAPDPVEETNLKINKSNIS